MVIKTESVDVMEGKSLDQRCRHPPPQLDASQMEEGLDPT